MQAINSAIGALLDALLWPFQAWPLAGLTVVSLLVALRQQAVYLRHALVPLVWVALPLAILAAHLEARYGYDGLRPGHAALVTVRMKATTGAMGTPGQAAR